MSKGWIGVDLDGTLAYYTHWQGAHHIGKPIPAMLARVKAWIAQGKTVKIFTARVGPPPAGSSNKEILQREVDRKRFDVAWAAWCDENGLPLLEPTATKDYGMIECWDDRAVQVVPNTGETIEGELQDLREELGFLGEARFSMLTDLDSVTQPVFRLLDLIGSTAKLASHIREAHGLSPIPKQGQ